MFRLLAPQVGSIKVFTWRGFRLFRDRVSRIVPCSKSIQIPQRRIFAQLSRIILFSMPSSVNCDTRYQLKEKLKISFMAFNVLYSSALRFVRIVVYFATYSHPLSLYLRISIFLQRQTSKRLCTKFVHV